MPRGDRTGPTRAGSKTGRAAGYCAGFGMPGYANPTAGRGFGMGYGPGRGSGGRGGGFGGRGFGGGGRGWRHWFHATGLPGWLRFGSDAASDPAQETEMEKQALKDQAAMLQAEMDHIKKRLDEIEPPSAA